MEDLTPRQLADGALSALANADALLTEARLLHEAGHEARAWALTHFSMEELAKVPMLIRVGTEAAAGQEVDWRKLNRRFREHETKVRQNAAMDYFLVDEIRFDNADLKKLEESVRRVPKDVELRSASLYVDWSGEAFVAPNDLFTAEAVEGFISVVERRVRYFADTLPRIAEAIEDVDAEEIARTMEVLSRMMSGREGNTGATRRAESDRREEVDGG
jgi:AbiV family abortive infection protein